MIIKMKNQANGDNRVVMVQQHFRPLKYDEYKFLNTPQLFQVLFRWHSYVISWIFDGYCSFNVLY